MNPRRRQRLTLAGSITGAMVVALDGTVLTVAQPTLQRDLDASFAQVQWTSTGYLIAVAALLVFAGRLGDRYGHRRVFAVGVLGFAATSAAIGLAPGIGWVIGLRVLQGVFGALLQPATLGMLRAAYPADRLGMPIALRTSAIGLAAAAGPVVGGALTTHFGWRAVFFLGVAPALLVGLLALLVRLPEPTRRVGLDLPGAALLALTLACLVHALTTLPAPSLPSAALGVAAAALFVRHERRTPNPLLPVGILRPTAAGPALGVLVGASAAMFGTLFLATYHLQDVLGLDPLGSGLRALPLAVLMVLAAPAAAVLMRRHGARRTAVSGLLLIGLGILLLARLDRSSGWSSGWTSGWFDTTGGFLLLGAGFGSVMVTATAVIVRRAALDNAGVAGGLQQTAMNLGPTLGVAGATTLTTLGLATGPALLTFAALATLTAAALATRLPGPTDQQSDRPSGRAGSLHRPVHRERDRPAQRRPG
ncbi:EmrB/QacA subfamily drug resistance transporter [Kitasatospora gansuensis]|uniref:EmrB/QacA subfamily drug resistance transporter n=2 Tax=Kitasatospora gansuensis TaxID=258050 RepID=A0A7W7SH15_9ACTN|nr:EmrB/QacA subfamily drug resistance transporter [Kitasatospora gansuensis]